MRRGTRNSDRRSHTRRIVDTIVAADVLKLVNSQYLIGVRVTRLKKSRFRHTGLGVFSFTALRTFSLADHGTFSLAFLDFDSSNKNWGFIYILLDWRGS